MTGGIGFSRFAQQAAEKNRKLKSFRRRLNDNPYLLPSVHRAYMEKEFQERKAYRKAQIRKRNLRRLLILLVSFSVALVLYLTIYLL